MGAIKTTRQIPRFIPVRYVDYEIDGSTLLTAGGPRGDEPTCGVIRCHVTVAGNLILRDWAGNSSTHSLTVGVHEIHGHWQLPVSATATLSPAATVLVGYWS